MSSRTDGDGFPVRSRTRVKGGGRAGRRLPVLAGGVLVASLLAVPGLAAGQELPLPDDPEGMQTIAGHRARDMVLNADPDSLLDLYPEIQAFMDPGDHPFGRLHRQAPPETEEYGRLAGVWYVETKAFFQGQWYCCWNGLWAWKYVVDGFAVQDYWFQLRKDLPPVSQLGRHSSLTQLRVFRPDSGTWSVAFVNNRGDTGGAVHGTFVSRREDGTMVMRPPPPDDPDAPLRRIVFYDISPDHFRWRSESSEDGGQTWQPGNRIEAYRLPVGPRGPDARAARILGAEDWANHGDGRDLRAEVRRPVDPSGAAQVRVMAVKAGAAERFDVADAAAVPEGRYVRVGVAGADTLVTFGAEGVDVEGDPVRQDGSYVLFALTVASDDEGRRDLLEGPSRTVTLARTNLVRTLTGPIEAGSGGMDVDARGLVYMGDFGESLSGPPGTRVYRITPEGDVSVFAEGLLGASGNDFASNGDLIQSSIRGNQVSRISPEGEVTTLVTEGIQGPVGVVVAPGDTLYVANCGGNTIQKVAPDGRSSLFSSSDLLRCPNGITLADDGNLYVANFGDGNVIRLTPDGTAGVFATLPGGNNGHILWGNGVLYTVARSANQIWTLTLDGEATLLAGSGDRGLRDGAALDATLSVTNDLALSPDGRTLYFNDVAGTSGSTSVISPVVIRAVLLEGGR